MLDLQLPNFWASDGWEAEWCSPYLVLTAPNGECASVVLRNTASNRNVTLSQFRSSVTSHGVKRSCEVFWKLRAQT